MTVGGLVDTAFRFNRLCECHLYTAPRSIMNGRPIPTPEDTPRLALSKERLTFPDYPRP
jgi:hypothetical protein